MLTLDCKCISSFLRAYEVVNELRNAMMPSLKGTKDYEQRKIYMNVFDSLCELEETLRSGILESRRIA